VRTVWWWMAGGYAALGLMTFAVVLSRVYDIAALKRPMSARMGRSLLDSADIFGASVLGLIWPLVWMFAVVAKVLR